MARLLAQRQELDRRTEAWKAARFPGRHIQTLQANNYAMQAGHEDLYEMTAKGGIVALLGKRGTGKTQAATGAAHSACFAQGRTCRYWRTADLLADFKRACYDQGIGEAEWLRRNTRPVHVLVIDEFHDQRFSDTDAIVFTRLIDHRYGEPACATIIIANQTEDAFKRCCGESVWSRLVETGKVIVMDGKNWRAALLQGHDGG